MGLSVLCLLHCLALPWLLASLPMVLLAALPEGVRENAWVHAALIAPVLMVSGPVLLRGRVGAGQVALVLAAFAALIGGMFAPSEAAEQGLTVAGTLLLLAAHWYRLKKAHPH
jgi:hypothetical protein